MGSVDKKEERSEEPWAIEWVVRFTDLLGYRETTLKSVTEPVIIALSKRVAEELKAGVASENAVKGDKQTNISLLTP